MIMLDISTIVLIFYLSISGSHSETEKIWVIGDKDQVCNDVCSAYGYTCDLSMQQTMTKELCGTLWYHDTIGYSEVPDDKQRGVDGVAPVYPEPAAEGWDDQDAGVAPCSLEFTGYLWYHSNKDEDGADLTCDTYIPHHYSLCSCVPLCPPINTNDANGGRCAAWADGKRCNGELRDYAIYCNSDNGWCGNTYVHEHIQEEEDIYDWHPESCIYESGIVPDNNIYYLSKYPLWVTSTFVVLILLNIFCIIMYICNKNKNENVNKYKTVSMTESDTEIPLQK